MKNDHGLFVEGNTACGYIFNFDGHGAFSPDGKVVATPEEINTHNRILADAEWSAMLKHGQGTLFLSKNADGTYLVSDWPGTHKAQARHIRKSWHNFAGKDGRTDVWFNINGSTWHGVNIGDNQILRVKRSKG